MTKDELLDAIDRATDENGRGTGSVAALENKTKDALYEMAQEQDVSGRSDMSKEELIDTLKRE
jgi:hypothetical protein